MSDLISDLHLLSKDKQTFKIGLTYKDGKAIISIDRNESDRPFVFSGPVQDVSDNLIVRFQKFLKITEEPDDELHDNIEETAEEIKDEEEKELAKEKAKAAKVSTKKEPAKKEVPKKEEPVVTAMDTILEKLDKPTKTSITKLVDRIKKGAKDPDIIKFLTDSFTNTLKGPVGNDELISKALAEVLASLPEAEAPGTLTQNEADMFTKSAATPVATPPPTVVTPPPTVATAVVTPPPVVQHAPTPQPAAQPTASVGLDDEGDLF
jgi:hypothetical protein